MTGVQAGRLPGNREAGWPPSPRAGPSGQQQEWVVHGITWCLGGSKEEAYGEGP